MYRTADRIPISRGTTVHSSIYLLDTDLTFFDSNEDKDPITLGQAAEALGRSEGAQSLVQGVHPKPQGSPRCQFAHIRSGRSTGRIAAAAIL